MFTGKNCQFSSIDRCVRSVIHRERLNLSLVGISVLHSFIMPIRNRSICYVCDRQFPSRQMCRILGDNNLPVQELAVARRDAAGRPQEDINATTRLCFNCNLLIRNEIQALENDPGVLRLNVLTQTSSNTCFICDSRHNIQRVTTDCRVNIYVSTDIFVPDNVRVCPHHLNENGYLLDVLHAGLRYVNRPYILKGMQLQQFMEGLREAAKKHTSRDFEDINSFSNEEFISLTSLSKVQFNELYEFCDPIVRGNVRYITRKHLLTFLLKLRQGISDDFLKVIFQYPTRQDTSLIISNVRISLTKRFVPNNLGFNAITRENYITRHVTEFVNELYNPNPNQPKAIAYIDCTYSKIEKNSNFRILRQSYCFHKKEHMVKPEVIVAPDGYILAIQGPYFSDIKNNDATILNQEFERDIEGIRTWFQDGDIFIVDRGYRDSTPLFQQLGINYHMPPFLTRGHRQFTTDEANSSRLITKTRWVVESRNGHFKSIFKFFKGTISTTHVVNLGDFYRIAGALINRFHRLITMPGTNIQFARRILERFNDVNVIQAKVEAENLQNRIGRWVQLDHTHVRNFPRLTMEYLKDLTIGVYQIQLSPSYIQEKLQRQEQDILELDVLEQESLIRFRSFSRFRNATKYMLWIAYNTEENDDDPPIMGYYCTCKSGSRTLGTCAHVASVLWFLGYARYQRDVHFPSTCLFGFIADAAHRRAPDDVGIHIIEQ